MITINLFQFPPMGKIHPQKPRQAQPPLTAPLCKRRLCFLTV